MRMVISETVFALLKTPDKLNNDYKVTYINMYLKGHNSDSCPLPGDTGRILDL
jgi:hypothetical protein